MARGPTWGLRTGVVSSRPVLVAWWWLHMPWYPTLCAVLDWFTSCTPVRHRGRSVGVVAVLPFDVQPFPRKETCLVEGQTPCNALLSRALTLDVSRGSWLDVPSLLPASWHSLGCLVGKAAKRMTGQVPVPYHASRDWRVRWERDRRIKCPGSRARVTRRAVSLRSTPPGSLEPVSVFDGSWRSSHDRFARRLFHLWSCGRRWLCVWLIRASSWGPRPVYGQSRYVHQLGYPLLRSLTVAPEPPFECWRSSRGFILRSSFHGGARATLRG